jgi:hypothetical protein
MLAGNKSSQTVPGIAVAIVGDISKDTYVSSGPPKHSIIWNIAPKKIISVSEIHRALGPKRARVEPFNPGISESKREKALIVNLEFAFYTGLPNH